MAPPPPPSFLHRVVRGCARGGRYSCKEKIHKGYYIPMTKVIERLLQCDARALEMVIETQKRWFAKPPASGTSQKIYVDIPDGLNWEEHPELGAAQRGKAQGGRIKIAIIMYYDGLEVTPRPAPAMRFGGRTRLARP